jgi:hypothetical protein
MNKYWIALLLAIAATQAFAGEKEYTIRRCAEHTATLESCDKCKEYENAKVSFKVSKDLKSIMKIYTKPDKTTYESVIDDCKIFDENTFECKTETAAEYRYGLNNVYNYDYKTKDTTTLLNGKWEHVFSTKGLMIYNSKLTESFFTECGYEIKNGFDFFN